MNTNRSYKLGTVKALKAFGARRGLGPYQAMQQANAAKKLQQMMIAPTEKVAAAFRYFAAVAHGGIANLSDLFAMCKDGTPSVRIAAGSWELLDAGSPGVSVQALTDLAQQYAYLHPTKEQAKRRYHEKYPRFFANK